MHCQHFLPRPVTRREMLVQSANGFGAVALSALLADRAFGETLKPAADLPADPLFPRQTHHAARAKNVIFLFMDGGPSQVDTFDPKPRLDREHGQKIKMQVPPTQFDDVGNVLKSPWKFAQYGQSGIPVSELFPHLARHVDDLAIVRSMTSEFSEHTNANYFIHSGVGIQGRPSMGAWMTYGLGSELPRPARICRPQQRHDPSRRIGLLQQRISAGLVPRFAVRWRRRPRGRHPPRRTDRPLAAEQAGPFAQARCGSSGADRQVDTLESAIGNYELAFRMQSAVPQLVNFADESKATLDLYGIGEPKTEIFGRQCLIARRLVERGVRFVELLCQTWGTIAGTSTRISWEDTPTTPKPSISRSRGCWPT